MPDFLTSTGLTGSASPAGEVALRLIVSLALGFVVAWIYRSTRKAPDISPSFPGTLVFLSVLIAMVTQVIGDNIARAFSLVGALSIVRFRTVVRDTQDTAYVIFAVVVGMAVGSRNAWVALIGMGVIGLAAFLLIPRGESAGDAFWSHLLKLRVGIGHDFEKLAGPTLDQYIQQREVFGITTAKQGISLDVVYRMRLRPDFSAEELVRALNRLEGIQSVELERREIEAV